MNANAVGFAAFVITFVYTAGGLPLQIRENFRRTSMKGASLCMTVLQLLTFSIWVYYGTLRADWYIVGSNGPGAICASIILAQFWLYRGK